MVSSDLVCERIVEVVSRQLQSLSFGLVNASSCSDSDSDSASLNLGPCCGDIDDTMTGSTVISGVITPLAAASAFSRAAAIALSGFALSSVLELVASALFLFPGILRADVTMIVDVLEHCRFHGLFCFSAPKQG